MSLGRRSAAAAVLLLTVATAFVRAAHLGARLPQISEADAVIVWQAGWLEAPEGVMDQNAWPAEFYPWLLARLLAVLPGRSYVADVPPDAPLAEHLAAASEPFLRGRLLSLVLATLAIPLTYRLARVWLGRWSALLAAAFLATSQLHTLLSQQARPHAPQATMSLIAVLAALAYLRRGGAWRLAGVATSAGAAFATLHTGVFALPSAWLAARWAPRGRGPGPRLAAIWVLAAAALAFLAFYPSPLEKLQIGQSGSDAPALVLGDQPLVWTDWSPRGYLRVVPGWFSRDPVLVCVAGLGFLFALWGRRRIEQGALRRLLVAGAYPIATVAVLGWHPFGPPRFFLGVFPFLAVLGAFGVAKAARLLGRWVGLPRAVAALLAALALALPAGVVLRLEHLRAEPDSAARLAGILTANAPRYPIHALPRLAVPVWMRPERISRRSRWTWTPWIVYLVRRLAGPAPPEALDVRFDASRIESLREAAGDEERLREALRSLGRGVLIVVRPSHPDSQDPLAELPREKLSAILGPPSPVIDGRARRPAPLPWRLLPYPCRRPFELDHLGPIFEVYRLDAASRRPPPRQRGR